MNITINPGAATADAQEIESIVNKIKESMETLDNAINRSIEAGIHVEWAETLQSNWKAYYGADVPSAMNNMLLSATNLKMAVDAALAYSREQG